MKIHMSEKRRRIKKFLLLCNHCSNPPCCRVCPTGATWQREDGIVMMDRHRCIGCRFCMAGCPYGSGVSTGEIPRKAPKALNPDFPTNPEFPTRSKGVVEKCTFCAERLAKGLLPACVEAADKIGRRSPHLRGPCRPRFQCAAGTWKTFYDPAKTGIRHGIQTFIILYEVHICLTGR